LLSKRNKLKRQLRPHWQQKPSPKSRLRSKPKLIGWQFSKPVELRKREREKKPELLLKLPEELAERLKAVVKAKRAEKAVVKEEKAKECKPTLLPELLRSTAPNKSTPSNSKIRTQPTKKLTSQFPLAAKCKTSQQSFHKPPYRSQSLTTKSHLRNMKATKTCKP